ncbi:MAG: hypothetical protein NVSMB29_00750 [Candidatus Dormibacteria bacterium]
MRANPEVVLLEDDPDQLEGLRGHLSSRGFHPLGARSASRAIASLKNNLATNRPVLAIVDWDLRKAPDQTASSADLLSLLARDAPDCLTLVYSANIDSFAVRSGVHRAHPRAWLHDKREGDESLLARIDQLLARRVADLRLRGGTVVVHVPTGAQHHHREAVRLVVHYPEIVTLQSDTATKAARRFGAWLAKQDSAVRLVSHGNRTYRLTVTP